MDEKSQFEKDREKFINFIKKQIEEVKKWPPGKIKTIRLQGGDRLCLKK